MSKLPDPTMTVVKFDRRDARPALRTSVRLTNEATIDALCEMAHEQIPPVDAIIKGLRQLGIGRALLRCPQED